MATLVQLKAHTVNTAIGPAGITLTFDTPVTSGNSVIVVAPLPIQNAVVTASDATNGAYTADLSTTGTSPLVRTICIFSHHNVTGGFSNVSITSDLSVNVRIAIFEVSGLGSTTPQTDQDTNSSATTHYAGATGVIGSGFIAVGSIGSSNIDWAPDTGYTAATATTANSRRIMYQAGTVSADRGRYTTPTTNSSAGAMVLYLDLVETTGYLLVSN